MDHIIEKKNSCPLCGHGGMLHWIELDTLAWCRRHSVLLCPDPEKLSFDCETNGCETMAEFVAVWPWCNQYSCRSHVGASSDGPWRVYGLTERAISAVEGWKHPRA